MTTELASLISKETFTSTRIHLQRRVTSCEAAASKGHSKHAEDLLCDDRATSVLLCPWFIEAHSRVEAVIATTGNRRD